MANQYSQNVEQNPLGTSPKLNICGAESTWNKSKTLGLGGAIPRICGMRASITGKREIYNTSDNTMWLQSQTATVVTGAIK